PFFPPGTPNAPPTCFFGPLGGPFGPRFDLLDNTAINFVPKVLPPPPPAFPPTPFEVTFVVTPGMPPCDSNVWSGNTYGTAFPACTTANGHQVPAAAASSVPATATQPSAAVVRPNTGPVRPLGGRMSG
ncbi:MAG: hypothetical protein M3011_01440, partial [Actinomycetota bacterium]|nr:hypothetical protein [Actinomycetota bacterium]